MRFLSPYKFHLVLLIGICIPEFNNAQEAKDKTEIMQELSVKRVLYGLASYYADKFHGRQTATGEIFSQGKVTAACNVLPLGTWLRVTNLKNGKSIKVKTNDRLHPKTRRIIDLSYEAARQLGYISQGLTRVKIEVLVNVANNSSKKNALLTY